MHYCRRRHVQWGVRLAAIALVSFYAGSLSQTLLRYQDNVSSHEGDEARLIEKEIFQKKISHSQSNDVSLSDGTHEFPFHVKKVLSRELWEKLGFQSSTFLHVDNLHAKETNEANTAVLVVPKSLRHQCERYKLWLSGNDELLVPSKHLAVEADGDGSTSPEPLCSSSLYLVAQDTPDTNQVFQRRSLYSEIDGSTTAYPSEQQPIAISRQRLDHFWTTYRSISKELRALLTKGASTMVMLTVVSSFTSRQEWTAWQDLWKRHLADSPTTNPMLLLLVVCVDKPCHKLLPNTMLLEGPHTVVFHSSALLSTSASKQDEALAQNLPELIEELEWNVQIQLVYIVLHLGYSVVLMDISSIDSLRRNALETFRSAHVEQTADVVFATSSSQREHLPSKAIFQGNTPWWMDTRLILVQSNVRTKYLWSRVVVEAALTVRNDHTSANNAFSKILSRLVWEQASLFGLRPHVVVVEDLLDPQSRPSKQVSFQKEK